MLSRGNGLPICDGLEIHSHLHSSTDGVHRVCDGLEQGVRHPETEDQRRQKQCILGPDHAGRFVQARLGLGGAKRNFHDVVGETGEDDAHGKDEQGDTHVMGSLEGADDNHHLADENTEGGGIRIWRRSLRKMRRRFWACVVPRHLFYRSAGCRIPEECFPR